MLLKKLQELFSSENQTSHVGLERFLDPLPRREANKAAAPKLSSNCMAGATAVQAPTIETKATDVKEGDDANQAPVHSARASSSRSGGSSNCRVLSRRPDGTSEEPGPSELRLLEQALRRESVVDVVEVGPLTVPSTPVRDSLDGIGNDVRINLELASVKLSKLAPTD